MNTQQLRAQQRKILVVDDEASFTRLLKINLESTERYIVRTENESKLALPAALDFRPDLILLDVMMPGLDGGDLANLLSKNPKLSNIPIVFLTATVRQVEVDDHAGHIGGMRFLAKPVSQADLIGCVEECLAAQTSTA